MGRLAIGEERTSVGQCIDDRSCLKQTSPRRCCQAALALLAGVRSVLPNAKRQHAATREDGHVIWLFTGSKGAGERAANIMSLFATAKANGHDPFAFLRDVLTRLPAQLGRDIADLLPHSWKQENGSMRARELGAVGGALTFRSPKRAYWSSCGAVRRQDATPTRSIADTGG